MIKIRLHGTPDEIERTIKYLEWIMELLSVSAPYKDRGNSKYCRVYIDAEPLN